MLTCEINDLARRIARSDPEDPDEQREILGALQDLRRQVGPFASKDLLSGLDSAALLMRYLIEMGSVGGEEIVRIISRIVGSLERLIDELESEPIRDEELTASPAGGAADGSGGEVPAALPTSNGGATTEPAVQHDLGLIHDMMLGEILVQSGTINSEQVCHALDFQREQNGMRFGDALVELGYATRSEVLAAVGHQDLLRREAAGQAAPELNAAKETFRPARGDLRLVTEVMLGEVLVQMGFITAEQLQQGLRTQKATGVRIGEALVSIGATDWEAIRKGLAIQNTQRDANERLGLSG